MTQITVMHGDCLDRMQSIPDGSVDLILSDLPYGVTQNKWDVVIPFEAMWDLFRNITKKNAAIVLTASQPFASMLILSNREMFRYDVIWQKTLGSGQMNVKRQPLRTHEHILIFYRESPVYNPQMVPGKPYKINRKADYANDSYGEQKEHTTINEGVRYPKSVLLVPNPRIKGGHPTQKPLELLRYLIRTYSNADATVLDCCMGSGSTGVAAIEEGRSFIGIEKDQSYYATGVSSLNAACAKNGHTLAYDSISS